MEVDLETNLKLDNFLQVESLKFDMDIYRLNDYLSKKKNNNKKKYYKLNLFKS